MSIICPECNTEIADGEKFCPTCAWRVRKLVKKVEVTTAEPPTETAGETQTCTNCGAALPKGAKFCNECGAKVEQPITNCPQCGAALPKGAKFCNECGAKISAAASTKTQATAGTATSAARTAPNPDMVLIQGGTFKMGRDNGYDYEKPVHDVTLSSYYISKYQVTQNDWAKIMGENPNYFKNNPANGEIQGLRPVECVNWYDVVKYCNRRSVAEGLTPCYSIAFDKDKVTNGVYNLVEGEKDANGNPTYHDILWDNVICDWNADGYRLPTEAEWEYAERGGGKASSQTEYSGSGNIDEVAWYKDNSAAKTHQVGLKKPNAAGLYDMSGNVWEWCWDWGGYYPSGAVSDPCGASSGGARVLRGGSWNGNAGYCRVSGRFNDSPGSGRSNLGLRVCCRA